MDGDSIAMNWHSRQKCGKGWPPKQRGESCRRGLTPAVAEL